MKVILSRKGFDSEFGGGPSPIMPDGQILSLPIPSPGESVGYRDLWFGHRTYGDLLEQLGYTGGDSPCHLDPDLKPETLDRQASWLPLFGQIGAAEGHLRNQGVGTGDLFLFFGWFRRTVETEKGLKFDPTDPKGRHLLFGYMEIGEKIAVRAGTTLPDWMGYHPHSCPARRSRSNNAIYAARRRLSWNDGLPGGGTFRYDPSLVLTADGQTRSRWALPDCFRGVRMTYHAEGSWRPDYFQAQSKGQEFVVSDSEAVADWARSLVTRSAIRSPAR